MTSLPWQSSSQHCFSLAGTEEITQHLGSLLGVCAVVDGAYMTNYRQAKNTFGEVWHKDISKSIINTKATAIQQFQ